MKIGVLALQGAFEEHQKMLNNLGIESFQIRQRKDLDTDFDGLIIPGGESTVIGKLLRELDLFKPLSERINSNMPVFGTCAGLILLANKISNDEKTYFGSMPIEAKRNAYGRQLGSFKVVSSFAKSNQIPMVFIRAPYIEKVWDNAEILSEVNGHIVAARHKNKLVTAFHPELTNDTTVHQYFVEMVNNSKLSI